MSSISKLLKLANAEALLLEASNSVVRTSATINEYLDPENREIALKLTSLLRDHYDHVRYKLRRCEKEMENLVSIGQQFSKE